MTVGTAQEWVPEPIILGRQCGTVQVDIVTIDLITPLHNCRTKKLGPRTKGGLIPN